MLTLCIIEAYILIFTFIDRMSISHARSVLFLIGIVWTQYTILVLMPFKKTFPIASIPETIRKDIIVEIADKLSSEVPHVQCFQQCGFVAVCIGNYFQHRIVANEMFVNTNGKVRVRFETNTRWHPCERWVLTGFPSEEEHYMVCNTRKHERYVVDTRKEQTQHSHVCRYAMIMSS